MMRTLGRGVERVLFWAVLVLGGIWTGLALYVQTAGTVRYAAWAALVLAIVGTLWLRGRIGRRAWGAVAVCAVAVAGWYQTIRPSNDRIWAIDVSRNVTAQVNGPIVRLSDIRDFDWQTENLAQPHWINETFDLNQIQSVDMATSVWSSPDIAHLLVSFGFSDGQHVVFSVEIRREQHETFNELGGFFRQFELSLIAATEDDIIRLRTHVRGESVSLFPVLLTKPQMQEMFMAYVGLAQSLDQKPRFYNTITANCTTVVWQLAHVLSPNLPIQSSLILSGHLPDYLDQLGVLGEQGDLATKRQTALLDPTKITERMEQGLSYSQAIRAR